MQTESPESQLLEQSQRLLTFYQQLSGTIQHALETMDAEADSPDSPDSSNAKPGAAAQRWTLLQQDIQTQMIVIKRLEEILQPLRHSYQEQFGHFPSEVLDVNQQTIGLAERLLDDLGQLEKRSAASLERLYPQVKNSVRAVDMQKAYLRGSRS